MDLYGRQGKEKDENWAKEESQKRRRDFVVAVGDRRLQVLYRNVAILCWLWVGWNPSRWIARVGRGQRPGMMEYICRLRFCEGSSLAAVKAAHRILFATWRGMIGCCVGEVK